MTLNDQTKLLDEIVTKIEVPESAYIKAEERYHSLGEWLCSDEANSHQYDPSVFPQGSFRLGTAIKPLYSQEEYDLDLACELTLGIDQESHSQKELKKIIGDDIKRYREKFGVKKPVEEKHRCWCMEYSDNMNFHMDIVPCIPDDGSAKSRLVEAMTFTGMSLTAASDISSLAVLITDDRHEYYDNKPSFWQKSNPEGYAKWFESRMELTKSRGMVCDASVEPLPVYQRKRTLQKIVQLLKRHRDNMFKDNPKSKPISVIITTIAGMNYDGSQELKDAIPTILQGLQAVASSNEDSVPNPVNPEENFADKWMREDCAELHLKENFQAWVHQVSIDFSQFVNPKGVDIVSETLERGWAVDINKNELLSKYSDMFDNTMRPAISVSSVSPIAKPWRAGGND